MRIVEKAKSLAIEKHAHLRMHNKEKSPVIIHIGEVAQMVSDHGGSEDMIAAAWLHDIVEDTDVTLDQINEWFGPAIASLVDGLTDPPDFESMPLQQRKSMQVERLKIKSDEIKRIKICDQLSNALRVMNDPPTDWDHPTQFVYIKGAHAIAEVCKGLCPALDNQFDKAYIKACKIYEGKV